MCTPYLYFNYKGARAYDLSDTIPPCDAVIFGGGAIEPLLRGGRHHQVEAAVKVAWGIGTSRRGRTQHGPLVNDLNLVGVREYGREKGVDKAHYVPCPSCMSHLFDKSYNETMEFGFYVHGHFDMAVPEGVPSLNNRAQTLEEAIQFLASAETIVTNSFHGTYWSLLLGKKVVCVPFSSKFYGFMCPPEYCLDGDWKLAAKSAKRYTEYLGDCRERNITFDRRVKSMISLSRRSRLGSQAIVVELPTPKPTRDDGCKN
jgi:hypothetical protein